MNAKNISRNLSVLAIALAIACIPYIQSASILPAATIPAEVRPASQWTSSDPVGDEWPMYGGQLNHTGYSHTTAGSHENAWWTVHLPNYGYTPVVSGGRVFLGCGDSKLYCRNAGDGSAVWNYSIGNTVYYCAVAGGSVFAAVSSGVLYCFNAATGVVNWSIDLSTWDILTAPAVSGGRLYVGLGYFGQTSNLLVCRNATTGTSVWVKSVPNSVTSPAIVGNRVYAGMNNKVSCLDAATGSYIWNFTAGATIRSSPAVSNGRVYAGDNNNVYCLNAGSGASIWTHAVGGIPTSPAILGSRMYIGTNNNHVYCLDASNTSTGTVLWSYTTGGAITYMPSIGGMNVYVGCQDHKLYCLNEFTGSLYWRCDLGAAVYSDPAIANGRVFVTATDGWVWCLPMILLLNAPTIGLASPSTTQSPQISLSWTTNRGSSLYYLYRDTSPITSIGSLVPIATPTGGSYTDTLTQSGNYYYAVVAANGAGNSTLSNSVGVSYTQASAPAAPGPSIFLVMGIIALAIAGIKMRIRKKITTC